jgi:hypothetical protein
MGSQLRTLVWNVQERRLRLPWRLALAPLLVAVPGLAGLVILGVLTGTPGGLVALLGLERLPVATPTVRLGPRLRTLLSLGVVAVAALLGVALAGRVLDRRRFVDFGFYVGPDWWRDLGFGLLLGALLQTVVFGVEIGAGWVEIRAVASLGSQFLVSVGGSLVAFVLVGFYEELLVRGYLLKNLLEGLTGFGPVDLRMGAALATLLSAGVFGVAHAGNPAATPVSVAAITLAGVMFGVAYLLTGELALPIGLHVTWNLFEGPVYGFPVSGLDTGPSLLVTTQRGPPVATGGAFGPEAGLVGVAAMLLGTVAIVGWTYTQYGDAGLAPDIEVPNLRWRD